MTMTRSASLKELRTIPGVGPRIAENLWKLGIRSVADLRARDPEDLYRALCARERAPVKGRAFAAEVDPRAKPGAPAAVDRCALYVLRCAVYYASHKKHSPEKLKWWNWKDKA